MVSVTTLNPGINKTLSLTYSTYDGVSLFDPQIVAKTFRERATVFEASTPHGTNSLTIWQAFIIVQRQLAAAMNPVCWSLGTSSTTTRHGLRNCLDGMLTMRTSKDEQKLMRIVMPSPEEYNS